MKPKPDSRLTITSHQDHQRRFPASPDGSWWMDAAPKGFTARAERELPRMRLAKHGGMTVYEGMSDASRRVHARRRSEVEDVL